MKKKILILGAGFGGLQSATDLSEQLSSDYEITLIDKNDSFFIGFSKFEIMFGRKTEKEIKYKYSDLKANNVNFIQDVITEIDVENKVVSTSSNKFSYHYLIVALGADLKHDAIPGFVESGAHEFYTLKGSQKLFNTISNFKKGTLVLSIFDKPYKCPPAPYEGAIQLHDYFVDKGVRDNIEMKMIIPSPLPIPVSQEVSIEIEKLLDERDIQLINKTKIIEIDAINKFAISESKEKFGYDLFIGVPVHTPPAVINNSKLGKGFILADQKNLQTKFENVYAIGDVSKVPVGEAAIPKAGAFAEDAAKTVVTDILRKEGFEIELRKFEATGACFLELGGGRVGKLNANFLGEEKPKVYLDGLSSDLRPEKQLFETSRRDKWFKQK